MKFRSADGPYKGFIDSGDALAESLGTAWRRMQAAAGIDLDAIGANTHDNAKILAVDSRRGYLLPPAAISSGQQSELTEAMEERIGEVLEDAVRALPVADVRRTAFFAGDRKAASSWVSASGDEDGVLCNATFVCTVADYFGKPQAVCRGYVGARVETKAARRTRATLDTYGHVLRSMPHPGGYARCGYHANHDANVYVMSTTLADCAFRHQVEPRNLLTPGLPMEARLRAAAAMRNDDDAESKVWRQIIPDIVIYTPGRMHVLDVKVINHNQTNYGCLRVAAPVRNNPANKRAVKVDGEYTRKAREIDQAYGATPPEDVGPCERALLEAGGCTGVAFGHYGEMSDTAEDILKMCGNAAAALSWAEMGFTSETHAAAHYRTKYRSRWAMNHCREKARHLLLNMQWVTGAPMNICAQAEAARERRAAWARSHRSNPGRGRHRHGRNGAGVRRG